MTEYVTMDLLLPLAGGLAGAALYHLGAAFFHWITLGTAADESLRKVVGQNVDLTLNLAKASGMHKVNIDALEERMAALENIEHLDGNLAGAIITLAERGGSLKIETPKVPYGSPVAHGFAGLPNTTIW